MGEKGGGPRGGGTEEVAASLEEDGEVQILGVRSPRRTCPHQSPPRELIVGHSQDDDSLDMSDEGPYENLSAQDKVEMNVAFRAMESSDGSEAREETGARGPEGGSGAWAAAS